MRYRRDRSRLRAVSNCRIFKKVFLACPILHLTSCCWSKVSCIQYPGYLNVFTCSTRLLLTRMFITGKKILEMKKVPDGLEVISIKSLSTVKYDYLKTTICDNMVYTLYREQMMNGYRYSFEKCNLDTHEMDIIFDGLKTLQVEENIFNLDLPDHSLNIFSVSHHKLFDENELVNKNF
ncbi:uncharacterized protein LOC126888404 [Diabrotica virgifera virgifera]|uniref:Uncharacterized protein n=1 Tax=Diabrotica virgifera virgifera TaxID=50390 RepID=A0ABM5KQZ3_DIAVI|nr:uncharacterized protein LOC126888404 [Diabrotica virgifera virgifera]